MATQITETTTQSNNLRVDREKGIIYGVKVIGFDSKNNRTYTAPALREAVSLYDGAKVNIDHPERDALQPRKVQDRFGVLRNAKFVEGSGVFADLHFNPQHALAEQLVWDAENNPSAFGLSHNAMGTPGRRVNGKQTIESITAVRSVDVVADPATTNSIFEHQEQPEMTLTEVTLAELKKSRPDLVTALENEAAASDEVAKLQSDLDAANKKIAEFEAAAAKAKTEAEVKDQLEAAGFDLADKKAVSDVFMEQLVGCEDATKRTQMIEDRKALVGNVAKAPAKTGQKPVTTTVAESTGSGDWLRKLRGLS